MRTANPSQHAMSQATGLVPNHSILRILITVLIPYSPQTSAYIMLCSCCCWDVKHCYPKPNSTKFNKGGKSSTNSTFIIIIIATIIKKCITLFHKSNYSKISTYKRWEKSISQLLFYFIQFHYCKYHI